MHKTFRPSKAKQKKKPRPVVSANMGQSTSVATAPLPMYQAPVTLSKAELAKQQAENALQDEVYKVIVQWEEAWSKAQLDAYMAFYSSNAVQGALKGKASIRAAKEKLWINSAPKQISVADIDITVSGDAATVEMLQIYTYQSGRTDQGVKVLQMRKLDGAWRIISERWSAL